VDLTPSSATTAGAFPADGFVTFNVTVMEERMNNSLALPRNVPQINFPVDNMSLTNPTAFPNIGSVTR
jgi:hypothetical protein